MIRCNSCGRSVPLCAGRFSVTCGHVWLPMGFEHMPPEPCKGNSRAKTLATVEPLSRILAAQYAVLQTDALWDLP